MKVASTVLFYLTLVSPLSFFLYAFLRPVPWTKKLQILSTVAIGWMFIVGYRETVCYERYRNLAIIGIWFFLFLISLCIRNRIWRLILFAFSLLIIPIIGFNDNITLSRECSWNGPLSLLPDDSDSNFLKKK